MTRSLVGPAPAGPSVVPRVDPRLVAVAGSLCIAFSPIFIALADVSPGTATFFRCALALPLLVPLALLERRRRLRSSPTTGNRPLVLFVGGALLGLDMTLWAESVHAVGAGVSTVLVNVQVVILPLLAFLVLGERVRRTFVLAVPVMLVGVALAGGLIGDPEAVTGVAPVRGTVTALIAAAAYAGYLLFVRLGAGPGQRFTPVAIATVGAAVTSFAVGSFWQGIDLAPDARSLMWLVVLAIVGQVVGWVLIASALPRLASSTGASILLLQPVGAVLLGALILAEVPGVLQLVGCAVVLGAVAVAARTRATPPAPAGEPAPDADVAGPEAPATRVGDRRDVAPPGTGRPPSGGPLHLDLSGVSPVLSGETTLAALSRDRDGELPVRPPRRARSAWSSGRRACRTCPSSDSATARASINGEFRRTEAANRSFARTGCPACDRGPGCRGLSGPGARMGPWPSPTPPPPRSARSYPIARGSTPWRRTTASSR